MAVQPTECGYPTIYCLPDGEALCSQHAKVLCCCNCHIRTAGWKNLEFKHLIPGQIKQVIIPNSLQDFAQDQVGDTQPLVFQLTLQPLAVGRLVTAQVIDLHGRIDNDHLDLSYAGLSCRL